MSKRFFVSCLILAAGLAALPVGAQFGQNKISYDEFDWQVYESPHFDVYYYPSVEPFLDDVVSYAESAYVKLSRDLDHELRFRVPLIIYKTHGEFQRTNVNLTELPEGVAAFAEPVQYRMVLPIDQPPDKLYELISHELVHIFEYSMFYEGELGRAIRSRPPLWIMEGLASYLGEDEDSLDQMVIRDAVVNNILPPIEALNRLSFLTYRYGNAIFDYIVQEHGIEGLRTFLFEFKKILMTNNLSKAIKESFGYDIDEFNRRFNRYLRKKYFPVLLEKKSPDDYGTEIRFKRSGFTASPTLSPSGELIAALAAPKMEIDLVVLSAEEGTEVRNLTKGWTNNYRGLVAQAFKGRRDLSWSPSGDEVAVFVRRENHWPLLVFNALTGKRVHDVKLDDIYECASPAFSPDGRRVAFEGNRDGVVDLFEVDLESGEVRNLTRDEFFDTNPWYAADGKTLLYNRRIGSHWKIFSVDTSDPSKKTQLTFGEFNDIQPSYSRDGQKIYFSSDRGPYGVFNIHSLDLASGDVWQYTDVVGGCFAPVEMGERNGERTLVFGSFFEGAFRTYRMSLQAPELKIAAAQRLAEPNEAEPFVPDLQLSTDEDKKKKYKPKWDIDAPSLTVGVADDGTVLSYGTLAFSDLLGDQRAVVSLASVSDFVRYSGTYLNFKKRYTWGGRVFDLRDYYVDNRTGNRTRRAYKLTGASGLFQYPFSRHFRLDTELTVQETSYDNSFLTPQGVQLSSVDDQWATARFAFVGDTTRYQSFGPFQGRRFSIGFGHSSQLSGDSAGDLQEVRIDFRNYAQVTRRSTFAIRVNGILFSGDTEPTIGFGGLNQLRGWDFREFIGSRTAGLNFEFRFPLIDQLRFPIFALTQIRGFFFLDVGAAWYEDFWYDPEQLVLLENPDGSFSSFRRSAFRVDPTTGQPLPFKFWDSENNRLQDGRATYGAGFQFFFGGLQLNWVWSKRIEHTEFNLVVDMLGNASLVATASDDSHTRQDFYIAFDW